MRDHSLLPPKKESCHKPPCTKTTGTAMKQPLPHQRSMEHYSCVVCPISSGRARLPPFRFLKYLCTPPEAQDREFSILSQRSSWFKSQGCPTWSILRPLDFQNFLSHPILAHQLDLSFPHNKVWSNVICKRQRGKPIILSHHVLRGSTQCGEPAGPVYKP